MKILPISKQEFSRLINDNCVYVDKTEIIYKLITTGFSYFLSRPRRFGKSLTLTTLKEIFSGNKELFKGLWIYDKIEWRQYPIIHFDFSDISKSSISVIESIIVRLDEIAKEYEITLQQADYGLRFRELIRELSKTEQIVILVDEYDKPIIDYIDDIPQAEKNRIILKNFYSVLKGNEKNIKFLFITGVSKFSKVSIFSDLNHLSDITLNPNYSILTGYTEDELEKYFSEYMALAQGELNEFFPDLKSAIRKWYNGYSWDGKNFVYNPFSLLNFFDNRKFEDYWFQSGTPTFLMKLIKQRNFNITKLENIPVTSDIFNKYELSNLELIALLFQTGYLTVKKYEIKTGEYFLSYPNNEVRASFERQLLETLSEKSLDENAILLNDIKTALTENNLERFIHLLKVLFKNITYPLIEKKENYFHSIFYLVIKLLGFKIETEVLTCDGRIDAVIKTQTHIYIIEFKLGTAQEAIEQIQKKQYALKYANENKKIILLGIGFNNDKKNIEEYFIM